MRKVFIALTMLAGVGLFIEGSYMQVKAAAAQWLIERSWEQRGVDAPPAVPWPWADTRVVAKLVFTDSRRSQMVMQDASGESLAFGPGLIAGMHRSRSKAIVIAGHRDSHFSDLRQTTVGEVVSIESWDGLVSRYRVSGRRVFNVDQETFHVNPEHASLTLITCWPFDALLPGGPERLLISAEKIQDDEMAPQPTAVERAIEST